MSRSKEALRQQFKAVRLSMSPDDVDIKSRLIAKKLLAEVVWSKIKKIHIYNAIASLNEVQTGGIMKTLREEYPQINLTAAGSDKASPRPAGNYDLILVPALAFDKYNYRLGWGGGWYDRFLASQPQALKIGLCFQNGLAPTSLPIEPHDVQLDMVITEEKIYRI